MISIKNLIFSYENDLIFDDFNFTTDSNFTIIKGPSGCGKSTFLKLLTGNLKPSSAGFFSVSTDSEKALLLQEDGLFPWMTGIDNIYTTLSLDKKEIESHPLYKYTESFIDKYVYKMSYGQRRIIELFRVILLKPKLLCLDEPFNFLDYKNRKQIMDFLLTEDFQKETKVVMSTHYTEDTSNLNLETYYFDGNLPVKKLLNEVEFKNYE